MVGRAIGRRRLTVLGLRPRHTAHVIAVATGMLITLITLVSVVLVSSDARVGLFRLNDLRQQIEDAEARLREVAGGDIAYMRNQEVLREVIDGKLPQPEILARLDALRLRAVDEAASNGVAPNLVTGAVFSLYPPNLTWEALARLISLRGRETVVRIVAQENSLRGESLLIFVQLVDRRLAYAKGTVLGEGTVSGLGTRDEISFGLFALVDAAAERAQAKILSPPFARITELPRGQVDVDEHRAAVMQIAERRGEVRVQVLALGNVMTDSPLAVTFALK
ncbi:MAG: DUF3084 domain-containing protein [Armatimonadetes bacterium]|nr:DUF3084 domain-containing protein [Armatimonadota bacterium]